MQYDPAAYDPTYYRQAPNPPAVNAQAPNSQAPYAEAPYGETPYAQTPYAQAAYAEVPYGQTPYAPYAQDPYAQAPYGQTPYAQDPNAPYGQAPYAYGEGAGRQQNQQFVPVAEDDKKAKWREGRKARMTAMIVCTGILIVMNIVLGMLLFTGIARNSPGTAEAKGFTGYPSPLTRR
ncbi:uncharacterized protein LOC142766836 [Rhipicephalus microplus]|uniref:uncharacterized protein LOC142766836 n=1 Tax=Rhipicephalus microplus TaxID=6941 RepID=UPI003F6B3697